MAAFDPRDYVTEINNFLNGTGYSVVWKEIRRRLKIRGIADLLDGDTAAGTAKVRAAILIDTLFAELANQAGVTYAALPSLATD